MDKTNSEDEMENNSVMMPVDSERWNDALEVSHLVINKIYSRKFLSYKSVIDSAKYSK